MALQKRGLLWIPLYHGVLPFSDPVRSEPVFLIRIFLYPTTT